MKLKNYCLVVLIGMLWSTGAMAGTVNIYLADVGELAENFHGIGPRLAQAIVNYQRQYGDFASIDELMEVRGIGLTIIKDNRGVIVVMEAPLQTQIDVTSD
jgi:competence protein ComEA